MHVFGMPSCTLHPWFTWRSRANSDGQIRATERRLRRTSNGLVGGTIQQVMQRPGVPRPKTHAHAPVDCTHKGCSCRSCSRRARWTGAYHAICTRAVRTKTAKRSTSIQNRSMRTRAYRGTRTPILRPRSTLKVGHCAARSLTTSRSFCRWRATVARDRSCVERSLQRVHLNLTTDGSRHRTSSESSCRVLVR